MKAAAAGIFAAASVLLALHGQETAAQENRYLKSPMYGQNSEAEFMLTQHWQLLHEIRTVLDANPPAPIDGASPRKMALFAMDAVLHDHRVDASPALHSYISDGADRIIAELEKPVKSGLRVFYIYDMGYVLKSPDLTVAIDFSVQQGKVFSLEQAEMIVSKCDMMFVTHRHDDHADPKVMAMFTSAGKKVIVPADCFPENRELTHLYPEEGGMLSGEVKFSRHRKLKYMLFPGHQNVTSKTWDQCNHVLVEFPNGVRIVHLGDQAHAEDMSWIKDVGSKAGHIDILFCTCWMQNVKAIIGAYAPEKVVVGHFNEMGHDIQRRVPYWYAYHNFGNLPQPCILMGWGEIYEYKTEEQLWCR